MQLLERALAEDGSEVQLAVRQNDVLVKNPRAMISSRLLEGRYPRWRNVFPQRPTSAKIDLAVGPALRGRSSSGDRDQRREPRHRLHFRRGQLVLAGQTADVGQSRVELPISYDGPPITITLDPRFVNDFLKVLDPEKIVHARPVDGDGAAVCTTDDGYGYVIMPLARDR